MVYNYFNKWLFVDLIRECVFLVCKRIKGYSFYFRLENTYFFTLFTLCFIRMWDSRISGFVYVNFFFVRFLDLFFEIYKNLFIFEVLSMIR